jgi:hypothetical protein
MTFLMGNLQEKSNIVSLIGAILICHVVFIFFTFAESLRQVKVKNLRIDELMGSKSVVLSKAAKDQIKKTVAKRVFHHYHKSMFFFMVSILCAIALLRDNFTLMNYIVYLAYFNVLAKTVQLMGAAFGKDLISYYSHGLSMAATFTTLIFTLIGYITKY